jgi:prepilin-type N-terminal cleavage/methylation domain-containing protein
MNARRAFTLVEVLTVTVIIGILVTLVTVAVAGAIKSAKRFKISAQMSEIDKVNKLYTGEFGEYPPDMFDDEALVRHVKKRFPRLDWTQLPDADSQAEQIKKAISKTYTDCGYGDVDFTQKSGPLGALALWLGGFPNSDGKLSGFLADPENPFVLPPEVYKDDGTVDHSKIVFDKKIFIDLEIGKNVRIEGFGVPVISSEVQNTFVPFIYFRGKSSGGPDAYDPEKQFVTNHPDPQNWKNTDIGYDWCCPYKDTDEKWKNPSTYQLIHSGLDGKFGKRTQEKTLEAVRVVSKGTNVGADDLDNLTNFSDYKELKSILP